jgi:hypothetical protein
MGNCSRKEGNGGSPRPSSARTSKSEQQTYISMNVGHILDNLEGYLWKHAVLTWVFIPVFGSLQAFVPFLQPSCETGFADATLVAVILYEVHHIWREKQSWRSTLELLAPPEIAVLRQIGVLAKRSWYRILGIVESLDLYTDVTFPFVARACEAHLTDRWKQTWVLVPYLGKGMDSILDVTRFWGFCLVMCLINVVLSGVVGLVRMQSSARRRKQNENNSTSPDRIDGEVFFNFAQAAETAMMPTVAMLSEEIGAERKFVLDRTKDSSEAHKARQRALWGQTDKQTALQMEMQDLAAEERVKQAANWHYTVLIVVKVLVGNCMQLWLHSSFYALTYDFTGKEAKVKVIISMVMSSIQALVRAFLCVKKLGAKGAPLAMLILFTVVWSGLKVYFTYKCDSHLWNLSTGCVTLKGDEVLRAGSTNTTNSTDHWM